MKKFFVSAINHIIIIILTYSLIYFIIWFLGNWTEECITKKVILVKNFANAHEMGLKIFLTFFVFSFFEILATAHRILWKGLAANAAGLFYFNKNSLNRQKRRSDNFIRKQAKYSRRVSILGASGWETFASEDSPLYEVLQNCVSAKIILARPDSKDIKKRSKDLSVNFDKYRREILSSIKILKKLVAEDPRKKIELRMYKRYPVWKYIIIEDNYAWVQQYPVHKHVRDSSSYAFRMISKEKDNPYNHIENQFKIRWDSHLLGKYNFSKDRLEYYDENNKLIDKISFV